MRIEPISPIGKVQHRQQRQPTVVDTATYVRAREKLEPCEPDPLTLFGQVDKLLVRLCPLIIGLAVIYLAAHLTLAILTGRLP